MNFDPKAAAGWLAGTLGRAGVAVLALAPFLALWVLYGPGLTASRYSDATPPYWWLSIVVLLVFPVLALRRRLDTLDDPDSPDHQRHDMNLAVLAVAATAACVVVLPLNAFALTADPPGDHVIAPRALGLGLVMVLTVLGVWSSLIAWMVRPPRRRSHALVGLPAGALTVLAVALLVEPLALYRPITHTALSEPPGWLAPVPAAVTRVGWTWEPPEHTRVRHVHAGTHGPILELNDGLVALDGRTGEELWSYRAPYTDLAHPWEAGVFDDGPEFAYVTLESPDVPEGAVRVVLDSATGRIVEQEPFDHGWMRSGALRDMENLYRTPDVHVFAAEDALSAHTSEGELMWERWIGYRDLERRCLADADGVLAHDQQVLFVEVCADSDQDLGASWSSLGYSERSDAVRAGGTVEVTAVDLVTGEENWRRAWEHVDEDFAPLLISGGPTRPEADPVVMVGNRALHPATGRDGFPPLPEDLFGVEEIAFIDGRSYLRTDSVGAVVLQDTGSDEPVRLHHVDGAGDVVGTTSLERAEPVGLLAEGTALEDVLVAGGVHNTDGQGVPTVLVGDLDGDITTENVRRIALDTRLATDDDGWGSGRLPIAPVPGAVVSFLYVEADAEGEGLDTVYGLVE